MVQKLLTGHKDLLVRVCALFCKSTEFFNQSASQLEWCLLGLDDDHGKWDQGTGNLLCQKNAWQNAMPTAPHRKKRARRPARNQAEQEIRERCRWLVLLLLTAMRCRSCLKPQPWALDMF